tara:strand:- start:201 stop:1094 length:894 start_codon:yes stop_codon:yes gene_type:complete
MNLDLNEITFVIVSYKAEKVIYNCLNSLPKSSKKIIIENSYDKILKRELELKYDNIEVLLNTNNGMGSSNNIGIKRANTNFVFILNPDVIFKENTIEKLISTIKDIKDFSIISPINSNKNLPNFKTKKKNFELDKKFIEVDEIDGFSMLINKSKFDQEIYFDENFFLYLENSDLCLRQVNKNEKIYIITNSEIEHIGSYSTKFDETVDKEMEYIRNWHWMWSKFYFNKKHFGYLTAYLKILPNLVSAVFKYLFYLILFNTYKKKIYKMRFLGILNSIIGNKSYLRPKASAQEKISSY